MSRRPGIHRVNFFLRASLCTLAAAFFLPALSPEEEKGAGPYDPKADAKGQIAAALVRAKKGHKRVLITFGGNWCGGCKKLHEAFRTEMELARLLKYEYVQVLVDVGRFDKNTDLAASYGADLKKHGVPFLTVLGADGKVLINQNTSDLESGDHHDVAKVRAFLEKWKVEPLDAEKVFKDAMARAASEKKSVLLHLGAPW